MEGKQEVIERWKSKIKGIRSDPPIDYKLVFYETIRNIADTRYSFLDIGTGTGRVIFENGVEKRYRKVVGIDIRPEMIKICKERAAGVKNIEFHVMDSTKQTKFQSGSFDVISAMFPPFDAKEINRLLSPGGYFVLLSSLKGDHKEIIKHFPEIEKYSSGNYSFGTVKGINSKLRGAGFQIVASGILRYKWIFKDLEVMKQFYEKISFSNIFSGKENRLSMLKTDINGGIAVTRFLCTTVARKI